MSLWLPASATLADRRAQYQAHILGMVSEHALLDDWNRELKQIDPYLELVRASPDANHPALKPGYYHVLRHNPGAAPTLLMWQTDTGGFREPDSSLLEFLRRSDLWSDRTVREQERKGRELAVAEQRRKEHESRDRVNEVMARARAAVNPSVSFQGQGSGWSAVKAGQRGARKAA